VDSTTGLRTANKQIPDTVGFQQKRKTVLAKIVLPTKTGKNTIVLPSGKTLLCWQNSSGLEKHPSLQQELLTYKTAL